jgi:hypothetical protein
MKTVKVLFGIALLAGVMVMTGCGPSREYYSSAPYPRSHFSLIISPTPGFVMSRYPDGRYYYRSPQGYTYWRGSDNRFYIDRSHIRRGHYDQREYSDWRGHNPGYRRHR